MSVRFACSVSKWYTFLRFYGGLRYGYTTSITRISLSRSLSDSALSQRLIRMEYSALFVQKPPRRFVTMVLFGCILKRNCLLLSEKVVKRRFVTKGN